MATVAALLLLAPAFPLAAGEWTDEILHNGCEGSRCWMRDFDLTTVCVAGDCATLRIATIVTCDDDWGAGVPWHAEPSHRHVCEVQDSTFVTFQAADLCADVTILDGEAPTSRLCAEEVEIMTKDGAPGPTADHLVYTVPGGGGLDDLDVRFCVERGTATSCANVTRTRGLHPTGTACCTDGGFFAYTAIVAPQRETAPVVDIAEGDEPSRLICSHVPTCASTEIEVKSVVCSATGEGRTCQVTYEQWVQGHGIGCHRLLLATDASTPGLQQIHWTPEYTTVCGASLMVGTLDARSVTFKVDGESTQLSTRALLCTGRSDAVDHHSGHACRTWLLPPIPVDLG